MQRFVSALFAVATLALAIPASAAEQVDVFPTITPVNSAALDFVVVIDQEPLVVGKGEFEADRAHVVAMIPQTGEVVEVVVVGDRIYVRENDDERWLGDTLEGMAPAGPVPDPQQLLDEGLFLLFLVGDVDVNGVATTQYQLRENPANYPDDYEVTSELWLDLFVGADDAYLHKLQLSARTVDPAAGEPESLAVPIMLSRFNQRFDIGAPPPDLVDEVDELSAAGPAWLAALPQLPPWARPLAARALDLKQR